MAKMNEVMIHRMALACADIYFSKEKAIPVDLYKQYVSAFIKAYKDKIQ